MCHSCQQGMTVKKVLNTLFNNRHHRTSEGMPRKRRPTPPLAGSIIKNLAPKPDRDENNDVSPTLADSSSSRHSTAGSEPETASCGVPQCQVPNCSLPTHLSYGRQRRLAAMHQQGSISPSAELAEATSYLTLDSRARKITLPIKDTPDEDFQRLFQQFFQHDFDRLVLIYRPQRRDPVLKQSSYRLALHNPIYCLTLIAQAQMINVNEGYASLDYLTDNIYSKLLEMTRARLESFDAGDVDVLLLAIVTLCQYDLQLDRYDALRSHRIGMRALVDKRGGIHNLGLSLPYVLRMDRFLAVRANELPHFASPEHPSEDAIMQTPTQTRYGQTFRRVALPLSPEVISLCSNTAQLFSLLDELNITYHPSDNDSSPQKLEYVYFLRENIEARHAFFNHHHSISSAKVNKDLFVLTAMKIVQGYVCSANYLPVASELLATRLWNMLTKTPMKASPTLSERNFDPSHTPTIDLSDWSRDMPVLLWLLFACGLPQARERSLSFASRFGGSGQVAGQPIVSPSSPRRQRYLPNFILHVAEHLVGERPITGTEDWDGEVNAILESFVWSGKRLEGEFRNVLSRLHEIVLARVDDE